MKAIALYLCCTVPLTRSFEPHKPSNHRRTTTKALFAVSTANQELATQKEKLLGLVKAQSVEDPFLADPITKQSLKISTTSTLLGGDTTAPRIKYRLSSPSNTYAGTSDTYLNLLEPIQGTEVMDQEDQSNDDKKNARKTRFFQQATPFIPPPLRTLLAATGVWQDTDYVPMRDLFTSPTVSFAYERGWRQSFAQAGFPGPDKEALMAMEYFDPVMATSNSKILVDMSCATGLFTRRFAKSGKYKRVLGCDYSGSMLMEARKRIEEDRELASSNRNKPKATQLDLVRLDVGQIPMKDNSIDALHAGAAMHCWPDLPAAVSEIYRVLKPGGRYFATTFLSSYFALVNAAQGGNSGPSRQAFQYFESVEQLRHLLEGAGFAHDKILIEVLGNACVVIRCEK